MKKIRGFCEVFAVLIGGSFIVGLAASAQQIPPDTYSAMHWRMIGPFRGGRVLGVSGIPGNPDIYYFGSSGGGVWKTTDAGTVWKPIFDAAPVHSIGALVLAPSNPNVVYVGTGENSLYGDLAYGGGIYKSTDAGQTWQYIGLEDTRRISKIIVDPQDPDVVLVAAMGHPYGPNQQRGIFRTINGGRTWAKVLYKDEFTSATDICFDPDDPKVVYATFWHGIRVPGRHHTFNGPGGGMYRSADGGLTWKQLTGHGLPPEGSWGRSGVAAARGRRVYTIIDAKDGGFFRSDDSGANWTRATTDARIKGHWFFGQVFVDPQNQDTVYVPVTNLFRSTDGGHTWIAIKGAPGGDDYHTLWIDPQNSQRMIAGVDQGATISVDGGKTWSSWYNQPTAQFYRVATDHRYPYFVYGPQQDSGTAAVTSRSDYGQITARDWYPVGPGESGYTIPDPVDPDIVYNAGPFGSVVRFFKRTGQVQDVSPAPILLGTKYRFNWITPMAFSPQEPHVLYLGTQFLLKTTDNGMSWQAISPDLTRPAAQDTSSPSIEIDASGEPITRGLGSLLTIAPSPLQQGVIWTGSDDGYVQLTRDGGAQWKNVTPPGVSAWSEVTMVEASHYSAGTAYVAINRNNLDDLKPYIYRTHDYGQSWQQVSQGIESMDCVHVVREDPLRRGLLYAGTERRVYASFDDGDHWRSLQLNMPVAAVHDLAIEQGDLVAATYGRSFWILDDLEPLRQVRAELAATPYLFKPRIAVRVRRDVNQDTPLPPEIPAGENPPYGAILDYYLPTPPSGEITLEIKDQNGKLVRSYSSVPAEETRGPEPYVPAFWLAHPVTLSKEPGMHRIAWNLRYTDPSALRKPTPYSYPMGAIVGETPSIPQGALALPGNYDVTLNVDGQKYGQPLELKMDPRITYSPEALAEQLDVELKIAEVLGRNFAASKQLADLHEKLEELAKADGPVGVAAKALDDKAERFRGEAGHPNEAPKSIGFEVLEDALTSLMELIGSSDFAPSQQSFASFQDSCKSLNTVLANWEWFKKDDVSAFKRRLQQRGLSSLPDYPEVTSDNCSEIK